MKDKDECKNYKEYLPPVGKCWLIGRQDNSFTSEELEVLDKVGNRTYLILVIYDITCQKRRVKLAKKLLGYGERVQNSAFECHLTMKQYQQMINQIVKLIDEEVDLLRVYRLTGNTEIKVWGKVRETYNEDIVII